MYMINRNFTNIKVGDVVAYDIGYFFKSLHDGYSLVKVLEITDRYESTNPLVKFEYLNTGKVDGCDIGLLFAKEDVVRVLNMYEVDPILPILERLRSLVNELELYEGKDSNSSGNPCSVVSGLIPWGGTIIDDIWISRSNESILDKVDMQNWDTTIDNLKHQIDAALDENNEAEFKRLATIYNWMMAES